MNAVSLLLIGAGGHARSCIDVIERTGCYRIVGVVARQEEIGSELFGYPVIGGDDDLVELRGRADAALVTVGQIASPETRIRLFDLLGQAGYDLPPVVSPTAYVSTHAAIGAGTIVMHGAVVNAGAVIGRNCIINSQALVEHDARVGDHCHVSTHAVVNGDACLGEGTFLGSGACVREAVTLGRRCVIGMGQQVLMDCGEGSRLPSREIGA
jgi:sugar O-acyltransferase (sialic acid O-acetyltransferase NeuD family)